MLRSSVEPSPIRYAWAAAAWIFPWLLSTTVHAALLLILALGFHWTHPTTSGIGSPSGVQVLFTLSQGDDGMGGSDPAGADEASAGGYYDDEPAPTPQQVGEAQEGGGGGGALRALLSEKPAVSQSGVLPASGNSPGVGTGSGGGVGSATGLTTQPRGSNRARGGYARTGVFGVTGEGHKFVYVFDRSGSMDGHGGAPLAAAKAELVASLKDLGQMHQFQIIFYNDLPRVFSPTGAPGRLVFGSDQNKSLAQKFVGSITADGATRHVEALQMALRMAPDVIFFLTDADEPRMTSEQLAHVVEINQGTSINTIEFGYGARFDADNFLIRLARQNNGKHVYVDVSRLPSLRR